jgi:hypothetical protein
VAAVNARGAVVAALLLLTIVGLWWREASPAPPHDAAAARSASEAALPVAVDVRATDERTPLPEPPTTATATGADATEPFATIRGRCVADEDGRPLPGCSVQCRATDPAISTAADGRFEVHVTTRNHPRLHITADARTPRTATWDKPLSQDAVEDLGDVRMRRGFVVRGRLADEAGTGIADSSLIVFGVEVSARAGIADQDAAGATTTDDGSFVFGIPIPAGDWEIQSFAESAYRDPFRFHVDAGTGCPPLRIVATRSQHIRAQVADEEGKPVALVGFVTETGGGRARSNESGELVFWSRAPAAGSTRILLLDGDWSDPEFVPPTVAWGSEDARILLHRGGSLPIAVVDESGTPVEEFAVQVVHESLANQAQPACEGGRHAGGVLAIPGVHRGPNLLRVLPRAPELMPSKVTKVAVTGDEREPLRIQLERLRVCPVQVVTQAGQPVAGSTVDLVHPGTNPDYARTGGADPRKGAHGHLLAAEPFAELLAAATTGADGTAPLPAPRDTHDLLLRVKGAHLPVFVEAPGLAPDVPLRVVVTAGCILRGHVLLHGQSADRFLVQLSGDSGSFGAAPANDGTFAFTHCPAGRYRVQVAHGVSWALPGSWGTTYAPLPATARDVVLRDGETTEVELDPGEIRFATVRGRVQVDGENASDWLLALCRTEGDAILGAFALAADGSYTAENVLPGRYCAALSRRRAGQQEWLAQFGDEFEVPDGGTLTRDFAFVPRKLTLQLRTADGRVPGDASTTAYVCWHGFVRDRPLRNGEVVLDPAPALPVQIGLGPSGPWSAPVSMPQDRREHTTTIVVPAK